MLAPKGDSGPERACASPLADSSIQHPGPFGETKIEIVLELARGTATTIEPGNAPFVVRTLDGTVVVRSPGLTSSAQRMDVAA